MRNAALSIVISLTSAFALAAGCGNSEDDPDPAATTGGTGGTSGAAPGTGGSAGTSGFGNSGGSSPMTSTACDDESPKDGEPCSERKLVCSSFLGSCVCGEHEALEWTCYEVGGQPDGSGGAAPGEGGQDGGGAGGSGDALGGRGGSGGEGGESNAPPEGGSDAGGQGGGG